MIPKRDRKLAKSDIQGRRNVTDYRISSLQMENFIYILLTGVSRGDKQDFSFSSQQPEVHISIFLYFTTISAGTEQSRALGLPGSQDIMVGGYGKKESSMGRIILLILVP